jgi:SAM-dependent methyltransferase
MEKTEALYDKFLDEYVSDDAVRKYTTLTAGYGITYLLKNDYGQIYEDVVDKYLLTSPAKPLRLLEFGCGAGMNITRLVELLAEKGVQIDYAYGTDFSPRLVEAAGKEAQAFLPAKLASKLKFGVAHNERLVEDLSEGIGEAKSQIGSFDLVIGVNTFRYCHRFGTQNDCAKDVFRLLRPGGVCVNIDMNDRFPAFRSHLKRGNDGGVECYLPSLDEYSSPFESAGFEILKKGNFCWIPHSAGRALTACCAFMTPILNLFARSRAMRSLVIARKPV